MIIENELWFIHEKKTIVIIIYNELQCHDSNFHYFDAFVYKMDVFSNNVN